MRQYYFSSLALAEADGAQPPTKLFFLDSKIYCYVNILIFLLALHYLNSRLDSTIYEDFWKTSSQHPPPLPVIIQQIGEL